MSTLAGFFHGSDTQLGVFYPVHYLVAIFPTLREALLARETLVHSVEPDDHAIVVSGEDLVLFAEEHGQKHGLWGLFMTALSRAFGSEAAYLDRDLEMARHGAAVLAVYCPTHDDKCATWTCLRHASPRAARYYSFGGIEHLAGEV